MKDQTSRHALLSKQKTFSEKPRLKSNSAKLTGWLTTGTTEKPIDVDAEDVTIPGEEEEGVDLLAIPEAPAVDGDMRDDALFVHSSDSDDDLFETGGRDISRRRKKGGEAEGGGSDDKKKLGLQTRYEGFAIYGRILCILVKRRGGPTVVRGAAGQTVMEEWVSTQVQQELDLE